MSEIPDRPHDVPWHTEAKVIVYSTFEINGIRMNITAREGATPQMIHDHVEAYLEGLRMVVESVKTFAVISDGRDNVRQVKPAVGAKPGTGAPPPAPPAAAPTPPVMSRPSPAPVHNPDEAAAPRPTDGQPTAENIFAVALVPSGSDGSIRFEAKFNLRNGKEAARPIKLYGQGAELLAVELARNGYDINSWQMNEFYAVDVVGYFQHGKQIPGSPNFYKDWVRFDIKTTA